MAKPKKLFLLCVRVFDWHDGDSFHGILDHGCRIYQGTVDELLMYRCARINTPELPSPEAIAARDYANKIAPPGEYQCWSTKLDEYGRPLLDLLVPGGLFSELMLAAGHAQLYKAAENPQAVDSTVDYGYLFTQTEPVPEDWFSLGAASDEVVSQTIETNYADGGLKIEHLVPIEDEPTIETGVDPTIKMHPVDDEQ